MDKPRIALFIPSLMGGGAERVMVTLANGFADQGFEVDLVLVSAEGPYLTEVGKSVRIVELGGRRVTRALPGLIRYLRQVKPRALLSAMYHANAIAILAVKMSLVSVPVVVIEQSSPRRLLASWRTRIVLAAVRKLYPRAHKVIACSHGVRAELTEICQVPEANVEVIYNPIPISKIRDLATEWVDHKWLDDRSTPVILAVGRMIPEKDFSTLISAFGILREQQPAKLIILGEGPLRMALESQVKNLSLESEVHMPGFVGNPYAWMSKATVFALSSVSEGLPTVLMEAMACGVAIVSTNCRSGPSEILENGRFGRLVPVGDAQSMSVALREALSLQCDVEETLAKVEQFGVASVIEQYRSHCL